jgi:hypothetical protein
VRLGKLIHREMFPCPTSPTLQNNSYLAQFDSDQQAFTHDQSSFIPNPTMLTPMMSPMSQYPIQMMNYPLQQQQIFMPDYNQWLAFNYPHHAVPQYTVDSAMYSMMPTRLPVPQSVGPVVVIHQPANVMNGMKNDDLFGPGPPIVTSVRMKGPPGSNVFVFHLPNDYSNW